MSQRELPFSPVACWTTPTAFLLSLRRNTRHRDRRVRRRRGGLDAGRGVGFRGAGGTGTAAAAPRDPVRKPAPASTRRRPLTLRLLLAGRSAEGDPAQEAWGAESARTPAAIMLEKVNLHLEALRMQTANHDVEVHLARQAIRALSEAVSRDAGETIAAMKLHRRVRGTAAPRRLLAPPSVSPALTLRVGCRSPRTRSRCCESATCCWSGT